MGSTPIRGTYYLARYANGRRLPEEGYRFESCAGYNLSGSSKWLRITDFHSVNAVSITVPDTIAGVVI